MKSKRLLRILLGVLLLTSLLSVNSYANEPFLGEVRWVSFNFPPKGWALCHGQTLPINQNQALFSLLGTTYGGDGRTTFALPDMRGRAPIHIGNGHSLGERAGEERHTLTIAELPGHNHTVAADPGEGVSDSPVGNVPAKSSSGASAYGSTVTASMSANAVSNYGGNTSHENMKPYIAMNCIIALQGVFPSPY